MNYVSSILQAWMHKWSGRPIPEMKEIRWHTVKVETWHPIEIKFQVLWFEGEKIDLFIYLF